jgi:hypothetical protein
MIPGWRLGSEIQADVLSKIRPVNVIRTAMALTLAMMAPTGVAADPQVLADSELDAVTAAGVLVDVSSVAHAVGDHLVADTGAYTVVRAEPVIQVGIGFTEAYASACCDEESDVVVDSIAVGAGDIVHGRRYTAEFRGATYNVGEGFSYFTYGYSAAFVLAISFEDGFEMLHQAWQHGVQEGRVDVRGMHNASRELIDASRDGFATGFELGAAMGASIRWQAAQNLAAELPELATSTGR